MRTRAWAQRVQRRRAGGPAPEDCPTCCASTAVLYMYSKCTYMYDTQRHSVWHRYCPPQYRETHMHVKGYLAAYGPFVAVGA